MKEEVKQSFLNAITAWEKGHKSTIDYYMKKSEEVIPLDGRFYIIDKPEIETSFCYGFGYCGRSTQEEEKSAADMAMKAKNDMDYFLQKNMEKSNIDNMIQDLENPSLVWCVNGCYISGSPLISIASAREDQVSYNEAGKPCITNYRNGFKTEMVRLLTAAEKTEITEAYKRVKESFQKRLERYLKRYGLSKVRSWSYLVD